MVNLKINTNGKKKVEVEVEGKGKKIIKEIVIGIEVLVEKMAKGNKELRRDLMSVIGIMISSSIARMDEEEEPEKEEKWTAIQADNHHVWVFDSNGKSVAHVVRTEKCTNQELEEIAEFIKELTLTEI